MLSAEQIQEAKFKRSNVSADSAKTKQRVEELVRHTKVANKTAIRKLAGVSAQVFHNIYSTGNISIKMVIAISQTLNVNPFYLTGDADEPGEFSDEALRELLMKHKYQAVVAALELPEKKKRSRAKQEEPAPQPAAEEVAAEQLMDAADIPAAPVYSLEEAEQAAMLRALHIKAKAGIEGAQERLDQINQLLLG